MHIVLCEVTDPKLPGLSSYSPFCEKIHRALRYADVAYERREGQHPGVFKKLNPTGKVPVLLVGERVIPDSTKILRWLVEEYPEALDPYKDTKQAAEAWLWEAFGDEVLNGFLIAARWADEENWQRLKQAFFSDMPIVLRQLLPPKFRSGVLQMLKHKEVWTAHKDCWERFAHTLDQLEQRAPTSGFWVGDQLTVADLGLFGQLQSFRTPITERQARQIKERPTLWAYIERVDAHTGHRQKMAKAA